MSADDRIEMDEDMAEFWAEVKDRLPGLLGRDGFVSAYPLADPGDVDIFTSWWNQKEEHIASLYHYPRVPTGAEKKEKWEYEPCFNLLVDEPGTDGRTLTDVTPKQVAEVIEKRAADQVREHLPGAWTTGDYFEWDESIIADFCDYVCEAKNMGEFAEYVQERADKVLARRALTTMIDYLLLEEVPFTVAVFPARIIPARAGFTHLQQRSHCPGEDHPRSRGVYRSVIHFTTAARGSSPLARGLRGDRLPLPGDDGIIPARAGFTGRVSPSDGLNPDHPRSRGVYRFDSLWASAKSGSSPLARGLRLHDVREGRHGGIIPARAGFTLPATSI